MATTAILPKFQIVILKEMRETLRLRPQQAPEDVGEWSSDHLGAGNPAQITEGGAQEDV